MGNYFNADGKSILEEGVAPTDVVRVASAGDGDDGEDVETTGPQKEPAPGPRPLSADDPVLQKALQILKTPEKKAA